MERNEEYFLTCVDLDMRTPSYVKKQGPFCSLGHYKYKGTSGV